MLALAMWEAGLCRKCGEHLAETTDPSTDPDNPAVTREWVADGPDECFSCKAMHRAETRFAKESPDVAPYVIWAPALVAKVPRLRRT